MVDGWSWLTPATPAAIAVIRMPALPAVFDRPLPDEGRARFACLVHVDGTIVDEVVVSRQHRDYVDMACHGGPGVRAAVEAALRSHGVEPQHDAQTDPLWMRLSQAPSPAAAQWLLQHGDITPPFSRAFLTRIPRVLITGPANAGKSTLLNALVGHRRALVSELAGTTRDLISGQALFHGWRLEFIDSAGLRPDGDELEQAGQALVAAERARVDVVLYLRPPNDMGGEVGDLIVHGKADLLNELHGLCWSQVGLPAQSADDLLAALGEAILHQLALPMEHVAK